MSSDRCPETSQLRAFAVGDLSAAEIESIGRHLADCDRCVALLEALNRRGDTLQGGAERAGESEECEFEDELELIELRCLAQSIPEDDDLPRSDTDFEQVGKYEVVRKVGEGGFARVFLAKEEESERVIALKIPKDQGTLSQGKITRFLREARTLETLNHPGIVPIVDSGECGQGRCYIAMNYIDGTTLAEVIERGAMDLGRVISLSVQIAEALHHAHIRGFVHRDIKPGNILIDHDGTPFVTDFGLAIHDDEMWDHKGEIAGTRSYMSPEQVRREAHRLDGRTDIWSLGVILYELLCGRRPFRGRTREELLEEIQYRDPKPPRQIRDSVPAELEHACLKCLAKKMADRYSTALDLANDLRNVVSVQAAVPRQRWKLVPRGLRPFGQDDAAWFAQLLPGPYGRDGVSESLLSWLRRIEHPDQESPLQVGLIYGPSGCGKSSFVRAGLLPRLPDSTLVVYLEATDAGTEDRLLARLRSQCSLPGNVGLADAFRYIREGQFLPERCTKLLVVVDQFEQWLHANRNAAGTRLVDALRQCDGNRVQCILTVRGDFWMGITRFMNDLEIPILEGINSAPIDLFSKEHAAHVLGLLGQAYGTLPNGELTPQQELFLRESVEQLSTDGSVICVRLAIFAEMVRDKSWVPETLKSLGGFEGVGVKYLEQTFSIATAPPLYRKHQQLVRAILGLLLPDGRIDIKGGRLTRSAIMGRLAPAPDPKSLSDALRILEKETRLITIVDAGEDETAEDDVDPCYELAHDFLVPSLREWLSAKRRESKRGRAELLLEERARFWEASPESRQLPTAFEWLRIRVFTSPKRWTANQKRMMASADNAYSLRAALGALALFVLVSAWWVADQRRARIETERKFDELVRRLFVADLSNVPELVNSLSLAPDETRAELDKIARQDDRPEAERIRASLVLVGGPGQHASRLIEASKSADLETLSFLIRRLSPHLSALRDELWIAFEGVQDPKSKLRLGALAARAAPDDNQWSGIAPGVVDGLLTEETLELDAWVSLLAPASQALTPALMTRFDDSVHGVTAARVLARFAEPEPLSELALSANKTQFSVLMPGLVGNQSEVVGLVAAKLQKQLDSGSPDTDVVENGAALLLRLRAFERVQPILAATPDPTARTKLLLETAAYGVSLSVLRDAHAKLSDPVARQAILIAMEPHWSERLRPGEKTLEQMLLEILHSARSQAERAAAEWILRSKLGDERLREIIARLRSPSKPSAEWFEDHDWWINGQGQTMVILRAPGTVTIGSPESEQGRDSIESLTTRVIGHSFAISSHEVAVEEFRAFNPGAGFARDIAEGPRLPANRTSLVDAMRYCRWLSEKERIPVGEMCYPEVDAITPEHARLSPEELSRTGYRLPTEAEWEYCCRAHATTPWSCGKDPEMLRHFAWFGLSAKERFHDIGTVRPNGLGLFDMMGNISEWCQPLNPRDGHVLRGGSFNDKASRIRCARRAFQSEAGYSFIGFRLARTMKDAD